MNSVLTAPRKSVLLRETSVPAQWFNTSVAGGVCSVSLVFVWLLLIHNRFFTPHEGWFSYYGLLMKEGRLPYRDFYFFTQPVSLLISRILVAFGDKLIYFRYYGMAERVVLTSVLYFLLSRQFSAAAAVCGTVASSFLFLAYSTDALFSYLYTCLLFFLLALVCLQEAMRSRRHRSWWMAAAGAAAAFSFFTKQSNGLLAIVSLGLAVVTISNSFRALIRDLGAFASGLLIGASPFIFWLSWNRIWLPYFQQVFFGAASSKGGANVILSGFLTRQIRVVPVVCFVVLIIIITALTVTKRMSLSRATLPASSRIPPAIVLGAMCTVVAVAITAVHRVGDVPVFLLRYVSTTIVEVMLYALLPLFALVLWRRFVTAGRESVRGLEMPVAVLIASVFWIYACGMSWSVEEQSLIPGLSLLLAFAYDRVQIGSARAMSSIVVVVAVLIIPLAVWQKWSVAFNWEGWRESISRDGYHSKWEPIADYTLDRDEVLMYDAMFDDIARYTQQGDQILTFPTIPLFNYVSGRPQPTFAPVHYWDVCPDNVARRDATSVEIVKPRMIINLDLADWVWKEHDEGWRAGQVSGQREMQNTLVRLTSSGNYRLIRTTFTPFYGMALRVWVRERG